MAPQNPVIFDGTLKDNLNIGRKLTGENIATDTELNELLRFFWLNKDLETSASDLSGGEKQRLALGRVLLMKEADVILLDEPSSELDDETTEHILEEFIKYATKQNQQIIMVTHDKKVTNQFAKEKVNMDNYSLSIRNGVSRNE